MLDLDPLPDFLIDLSQAPATARDGGAFLGEGRRNTDLTRFAGSLRRMFGLDAEGLAHYLHPVNAASSSPLSPREVDQIARSIGSYETDPAYELDEVHLSRVLAAEIANCFKFCPGIGWLHYTGTHWEHDIGEKHVQERVKSFLSLLYQSVKARGRTEDVDRLKALKSWLKAARVKNVIALASSDPNLLIPWDRFDSAPGLLNARNGTIEFGDGTIRFREHRAEDLLTKVAEVEYDPDAQAPLFDGVMSKALGSDLGPFVMRLFGYAMTGRANERVFAILHGRGANGKSTVVNIVQRILGRYSVNVEPATFLQNRSGAIRSDIARLRGARLAVSSEFGLGQIMDAPLMKQLVGGDLMTARELYQREFEFRPTVLPVLVTNALPVINGGDEALASRIVLAPFENIVPPEERDPGLPDKLWEERSGILNLLLAGMEDYLQGGLRRPRSVVEAVETYVQGSDLIGQFLSERCTLDPVAEVAASALLSDYCFWCSLNGYSPMSSSTFKAEIAKRQGVRQVKKQSANKWVGVTLKPSVEA